MYDVNEQVKFVSGNKAGNTTGPFSKYAWEMENAPRNPALELVGAIIIIPIAIIIFIGIWVFSRVQEFLCSSFWIEIISPGIGDVPHDWKWRTAYAAHAAYVWACDDLSRTLCIGLAGVVMVQWLRIRSWKKDYAIAESNVNRMINYCDQHGL